MLELLDLLTKEESEQVYQKVYKNKESWIHRQVDLDMPFYSLGAASYLDIPVPPEEALKNGIKDSDFLEYRKLFQRFNPLLESDFAFLYEKLIKTFQEKFNCGVKLCRSLAMPGFHIYLADWFFQDEMGIIHCDLQYMSHDWQKLIPNAKESSRTDLDQHISFTVAIKLPKFGGGLYTWDYKYADVCQMNFQERQEYLETKDKKYIEYSEGQVAVHSGDMYHQIAPMQEVQNEDERITLQGHGALIENTYYLYW